MVNILCLPNLLAMRGRAGLLEFARLSIVNSQAARGGSGLFEKGGIVQNMSRVAGTVFAAAALSAVAMPSGRALADDWAPQVHPASIGAVAARHAVAAVPAATAAPAAPARPVRAQWWRDDCDHYGGHCHRRLHDVSCRYKHHRRECQGWDGDRPWRSYDEWWYDGPGHEFDRSDGPGEHWRGLGDGRGGDGWRWRDDGGDHRSVDPSDDGRPDGRGADNRSADHGDEGRQDGRGADNRSTDRGTVETPGTGTGTGDSRVPDRDDAPSNPGTGGGRPADRGGEGQGPASDSGAGTPAMGRGDTPTGG
jgi:hypothetical protein